MPPTATANHPKSTPLDCKHKGSGAGATPDCTEQAIAMADDDVASAAVISTPTPPVVAPTNRTPTQGKEKRFARELNGLPSSPSKPADTGNDEALAKAMAEGTNQSYRKKHSPAAAVTAAATAAATAVAQPPTPHAATKSPVSAGAAFAPAAAAAAAAADASADDKDPVCTNLPPSRLDFDAEGFGDLQERPVAPDVPFSRSLVRVGAAVLTTAAVTDKTTLLFEITAQRSKVRPKSGQEAVQHVVELLQLTPADPIKGASVYADAEQALVTPGRTLPSSATMRGGFKGTDADPLISVQVLLRFKPTSEPRATAQQLPKFDGSFDLCSFTENQVTGKVLAHVKECEPHFSPVSWTAVQLYAFLKTQEWTEKIEYGNLPLSVFALGPVAESTSQAQAEALITSIIPSAITCLLKCEQKALPKCLVVVPARYTATHTVRCPKGEAGVKFGYPNPHSICSPADDRPHKELATSRCSTEAVALTLLATMRFPQHFSLRKLTRKRVCIKCLGGDHTVSKCKGQEVCKNCSAERCKPICPHPALCGICGKGHRTMACEEYRGVYAEPTDRFCDLPERKLTIKQNLDISTFSKLLAEPKYERLRALLHAQKLKWKPENDAQNLVLGQDSDDDGESEDTWQPLKPAKQLMEVAQEVRRIARARGNGKPVIQETIPLTATLARQYIEKVMAQETRRLDAVRLGKSRCSKFQLEDVPAPPDELLVLGLTKLQCWEYAPAELIHAASGVAPLPTNGRRNRQGRGANMKNTGAASPT